MDAQRVSSAAQQAVPIAPSVVPKHLPIRVREQHVRHLGPVAQFVANQVSGSLSKVFETEGTNLGALY
jgi:hypothetical protein